jgi:hypothetical protein
MQFAPINEILNECRMLKSSDYVADSILQACFRHYHGVTVNAFAAVLSRGFDDGREMSPVNGATLIVQFPRGGRDSSIIKEMARKKGMRTLREDGWLKVKQGITTVSEVLRVTQEEVAG